METAELCSSAVFTTDIAKCLFQFDSLYRAYTCTGSALGANRRIDYVNITSGDSLYGALVDTSTTSGASICFNLVSHDSLFFNGSE